MQRLTHLPTVAIRPLRQPLRFGSNQQINPNQALADKLKEALTAYFDFSDSSMETVKLNQLEQEILALYHQGAQLPESVLVSDTMQITPLSIATIAGMNRLAEVLLADRTFPVSPQDILHWLEFAEETPVFEAYLKHRTLDELNQIWLNSEEEGSLLVQAILGSHQKLLDIFQRERRFLKREDTVALRKQVQALWDNLSGYTPGEQAIWRNNIEYILSVAPRFILIPAVRQDFEQAIQSIRQALDNE